MDPLTLQQVDFWSQQRILLTGHTGFIGGWMHKVFTMLGATVYGVAKAPDKNPNLYTLSITDKESAETIGDVADLPLLHQVYRQFQPTIIVHLAAEAIVCRANDDPINTYHTNIIGTLNMLEIARTHQFTGSMVIFTTDKVYANHDSGVPFKESDPLGNGGIYDSSKACAELIAQAYYQQYLSMSGVATLRAGNVIGGGDWNPYRIIPDAIRASISGVPLQLRMPNAVRPWQHVLESVYATILLIEKLHDDSVKFSGAWNIGPEIEDQVSVLELVKGFYQFIDGTVAKTHSECTVKESQILRLDTSKAKAVLGWSPKMTIDNALGLTGAWYQALLSDQEMLSLTEQQIREVIPLP